MSLKPSPAAIDRDTASRYILANFEPEDRVAIVLIHKRSGSVLQRLASAERIAAPDYQAWLRHKNAARNEVYISMNALNPDAHGRTKADVGAIRHIYLDFDDKGTASVENLLKRNDLPEPNFLLNSSPDKWQVVWKVAGFAKEQAEELQRSLARETGADPAATDCARVMRIPGFYNHKYATKHLIGIQALSAAVYAPDRFPKLPTDERGARASGDARRTAPMTASGGLSQSEHDWAYAKRALAHGDSVESIVAAIMLRRTDKPNPHYYAELTVTKAAESFRAEKLRSAEINPSR